MRVAVVTTVRKVGPPLVSFLRYHLQLGIDRIYVYFDDPNDGDLAIVAQLDPRVTAIPCDAALRGRWRDEALVYRNQKDHIESEVMARQVLNADLALRQALAEGIDWLVHIDGDELLWFQDTPPAELFGQLTRDGVEHVCFKNLEATPETEEVGDYFREVTLFKKSKHILPPARKPKALPFIAYDSGKGAVRVREGVIPFGVHAFSHVKGPIRGEFSEDGFVLHYPSCGFSRYWEKYELLGKFQDKFFGETPIPFDFHLLSRDVVTSGDRERALDLYRSRVAITDPARVRRLISGGLALRIEDPARILGASPRARTAAASRRR